MSAKQNVTQTSKSPQQRIEISSNDSEKDNSNDARGSDVAAADSSREQLRGIFNGMLATVNAKHGERRKKAELDAEVAAANLQKKLQKLHDDYVQKVIQVRCAQLREFEELVRKQTEVEKAVAAMVEEMEEDYRVIDSSQNVVINERVKKLEASKA